ncbi:MAG: hypothetical protein KAI83_04655 [Thiomargarita sp.]|nr:hypothetical protein [Thiomargarita sp.]
MGNNTNTPVVGILGWEARNNNALSQLGHIPGDIAHPSTFSFPVLYKQIEGAYYETVIVEPSAKVLISMIDAAKEMERNAVKAIMTDCGYNGIFQQELANAVNIPVFASSLLQIPLVHLMLRKGQKIGIIAAYKEYLTEEHLRKVGISENIPVCILGIENTEFSKVRAEPLAIIDVAQFEKEVVSVAKRLIDENREVGAIVLECTDLPPFAAIIRRKTGLPVFDIVTLAHMVYETIAGERWGHFPMLKNGEIGKDYE